MATIFGKNLSKRDFLRHVGDMSQIAGIRPIELVNGAERGIRAMDLRTGTGFEFTALADRALDIFEARYNGLSLAWHSQAGPVAPAFYDRHDTGWLWTMPGGLLVTCGLTQVGSPNVDEDEELGLHGRVSNIPAKNVAFGADWEEDEYILWVSGEVREGKIFGPNLIMRRNIYTRMGQSRLWIKDEIENQGFEETPLMFLYHCNIGYPIVGDGAELLAVIENVEPRDEEAEQGLAHFDRFETPTPNYTEQCFFIDHDENEKGMVNVALVNRSFNNSQGIGVYMTYSKKELPQYTQWKMMGEGTYVVGMEPGNCVPEGRESARKRGVLKTLLPGELATFHLEIGVLGNNHEIRAFESKLRGFAE